MLARSLPFGNTIRRRRTAPDGRRVALVPDIAAWSRQPLLARQWLNLTQSRVYPCRTKRDTLSM